MRFPPSSRDSASSWLTPGGAFGRNWASFEVREGQVQMAEAVERALANESILFCEAGTGTGKTLAYLLPALQSGRRVVISTATRALQDQIWNQDLPLIEQILGRSVSAMVMKGLSNYLCRRRTQTALLGESLMQRRSLNLIEAWSHESSTGELSELELLREGDPVLGLVQSSSETRIGARCPYHESCFVTRMKRNAEAAQLLIVNHHLFFADLALRGPHPGRVIPDYDAVILDEAHQVEDIAGLFFGVRVSQRRLRSLTRDAASLFSACGSPTNLTSQVEQAEAALFDALKGSASGQRARLDRESWTGPAHRAYLTLDSSLEGLSHAANSAMQSAPSNDDLATREGLESVAKRARELRDALSFVVDDPRKHVTWLDISEQGHALSASPVDLAPILSERLFRSVPSVILTSATLATPPAVLRTEGEVAAEWESDEPGPESRFSYYRTRLGATDSDFEVQELVIDSPFDFKRNALLYLAKDLPEPREEGFEAAALDTVMSLLLAADGGAFVLTTSVRAMREWHTQLKRVWNERAWPTAAPPLLLQGSAPKAALLSDFRASGRAVLVATTSFWEGVDVPGSALRLVIIDKIPFAVPTDPLIQARVHHLEEAGLNPFTDLFIPSAQVALKQGFGRLIRCHSDRGVVALLDSRICRKGYGQRILSALPAARRTTRLQDALAFFSRG